MWDKEWIEYLKENKFYYVTLNKYATRSLSILPYFKYCDQNKYLKYYNDHSYTGTWEDYERDAHIIHKTINLYNTDLLDLTDNQLFISKEFGQLCSIIKDVYSRGTFNVPTVRFDGDELNVHPGNHLCYAMLFFGMPISCFVTTMGEIEDYQLGQCSIIHKQIKTRNDVVEILGTDQIESWIQTYNNKPIPHIYPNLGKTSWLTHENGDCEWPWDQVEYYNQTLKLFPEQEWFDYVRKQNNTLLAINERYRVKTLYPSTELLLNNFFAFLLNQKPSDKNFERI